MVEKKKKLHRKDRDIFQPSNDYFLRDRPGLHWCNVEDLNRDYLLELRGSKSRESIGRKVGRHPAQVARYEARGYAAQLPEFSVLRRLCAVLQANPVKLLNLCLHFPNKASVDSAKQIKKGTVLSKSETVFVLDILKWVGECSDDGTEELIKSLISKLKFLAAEEED